MRSALHPERPLPSHSPPYQAIPCLAHKPFFTRYLTGRCLLDELFGLDRLDLSLWGTVFDNKVATHQR